MECQKKIQRNIMALKDYLNKQFMQDDLGLVEVISIAPKSRTMVAVKVLDRGKGWNEAKQRYTGVRISTGWYRGENREYENVDTVHINTLTECQK